MQIEFPLRASLRSVGTTLLLATSLVGCSHRSPSLELRQDYVALQTALDDYARANGGYPERLTQLTEPDSRGHRHIEDDALLTDPFGNPYAYTPPSGPRPPKIKSYGADGVHGVNGVNGEPNDDIELGRAR